MPAIRSEVGQETLGRGLAGIEPDAIAAVRGGEQSRSVVGQEVDVRLDGLAAGLAEGEDPERNPRIVGRDRDVDRRAVAHLLAARLGRVRVEGGGEEDRAALGVEVEDLGRVGREAEAVVRGPGADVSRAALQDGDVEGVDLDLHDLLGAAGCRRGAGRGPQSKRIGLVSRTRRWSVQSPPFSTLVGTPGNGVIEPKAPPPPANWKAVT